MCQAVWQFNDYSWDDHLDFGSMPEQGSLQLPFGHSFIYSPWALPVGLCSLSPAQTNSPCPSISVVLAAKTLWVTEWQRGAALGGPLCVISKSPHPDWSPPSSGDLLSASRFSFPHSSSLESEGLLKHPRAWISTWFTQKENYYLSLRLGRVCNG